MKNNFETSLLESGEIFKRGYMAIAGNAGKAVAVITLIVSTLVLFTDISFSGLGGKNFTSTVCVMLLASYLMYFSMEDAGEKLGESSDEYKFSKERYDLLAEHIKGDMMPALRDFCKAYTEAELKYRRSNYLMTYGYSEEDLEKYKSGEACDKHSAKILKRSMRIKAIPLSPKMLLSAERRSETSELQDPEYGKIISMILKLVPTTLCTVLTVSVMLTAKSDLTAAVIIDGIFKLSSLPVIGFRGYAAGYAYTRHTLPAWIDTKSRLLDTFLKTA